MDYKKILTISIAAYNVERYLRETLQSLISNELFSDVEIIIVDDGSRDKTAEIGREYEEQYPDYIRLVSKNNGGHGSTLNTGISLAQGKYYRFLDGDDWVDTVALIKAVNYLKESDSDLVCFNYSTVNEETGQKVLHKVDDVIYGKEYSMDQPGSLQFLATQHLFVKTEVFKNNNIRIDENCFYVDMEYSLLAVLFSSTITYYDEDVYQYRIGLATQSMSKAGLIKNYKHRIRVVNCLAAAYRKANGVKKVAEEYVSSLVAENVNNVINGFMLFPLNSKNVSGELWNFMNDFKTKSPQIYELAMSELSIPLIYIGDGYKHKKSLSRRNRYTLLQLTHGKAWKIFAWSLEVKQATKKLLQRVIHKI